MLTQIAFAAKRHWDYPERWIESWSDSLTVKPEFIASHDSYVAVVEGQPIGFYASGWKNHRMELVHLWVLPAGMGRGIGRLLFVHAVEQARLQGARALEIESGPNAEGFYQRPGARRVGMRITQVQGQRRELPVLIYEICPPVAEVEPGANPCRAPR